MLKESVFYRDSGYLHGFFQNGGQSYVFTWGDGGRINVYEKAI